MHKMVNLFKISEAELSEMESFRAMTSPLRSQVLDVVEGRTNRDFGRELAFELGFRLAGSIGWSQAYVNALDVLRLESEIRASLRDPDSFGLTLVLENGEKFVGPVDYWNSILLRFRIKGGRRIDYVEVKEHGTYNI